MLHPPNRRQARPLARLFRTRVSARFAGLVGLVALAALVLPGCFTSSRLDTPEAQRLSLFDYPEEAGWVDPDPDIRVIRDGDQIRVMNREVNAFVGVELWLNQQYVMAPVDLPAGTTRLPLSGFVNLHREAYPTAGFLAPERDQELLVAEIILPGSRERVRMVVLPVEREQLPF